MRVSYLHSTHPGNSALDHQRNAGSMDGLRLSGFRFLRRAGTILDWNLGMHLI
jgi:hypothetical protein